MALFSVAAGFLWSIATLYRSEDVAEMPRRVDDYSVIAASVYVDVSPLAYVLAGVVAAVGVLVMVAASRLR